MVGTLAQALCLVTHGSHWLGQPESVPVELEESNSTFQVVREVRFVGAGRRPTAVSSVGDWFEALRRGGYERLWFVPPSIAAPSVSDWKTLDQAASGPWRLAATGAKTSLCWEASWSVGEQDAPNHRVWDVTYRASKVRTFRPQLPDIETSRRELASVLLAISSYSPGQSSQASDQQFERAAAICLGDSTSRGRYHADMLPDAGYSPEAHQLAAAAREAWAFTGMGSWLDNGWGSSDNQQGIQRTRALLDAVLTALTAAANTGATN